MLGESALGWDLGGYLEGRDSDQSKLPRVERRGSQFKSREKRRNVREGTGKAWWLRTERPVVS